MANNNPANTCLELNNLLDEICKFLSNEKNISNSATVRSRANELIEKLKMHSKPLSLIKEFPVGPDGESYVEMKGQITSPNTYVQFEKTREEIYSDIPENENTELNVQTTENRNTQEISCPFLNKKYSDIRTCRKRGVLSKREKMLFFDTNRKYFAIIHENWFLLYGNEGDSQATHILNLQEVQGRVVEENPKSFLVLSKANKAPHIFFAVSQKDKLQWLAAINSKKTYNCLKMQDSISNGININTSEMTLKSKHESKEAEEIYEMVEEEDYDRVDNSHLKINTGTIKTKKKPLPRLPSPPAPAARASKPSMAAPPGMAPIIKLPTPTRNVDEPEDEYDTVCAPQNCLVSRQTRPLPPIRRPGPGMAAVHPALVSDLQRLFSKEQQEPTRHSEEYYDPVVGAPSITLTYETPQSEVMEDDIYDSVVNVVVPPTQLQSRTINELKSRLSRTGTSASREVLAPAQPEAEPELPVRCIDDIFKPEVKLEKTKSVRRRFYFFKEAAPTKIV